MSVSADDIRDVINVTSEEVPDDNARIPEQKGIRSHCGSRGYNQVGEDASHSWFPDTDESLLILEERVALYSILLEC